MQLFIPSKGVSAFHKRAIILWSASPQWSFVSTIFIGSTPRSTITNPRVEACQEILHDVVMVWLLLQGSCGSKSCDKISYSLDNGWMVQIFTCITCFHTISQHFQPHSNTDSSSKMGVALSLPVVGYFLMPSLASYSASLNLLFFYMVWIQLNCTKHESNSISDMEHSCTQSATTESRNCFDFGHSPAILPGAVSLILRARFDHSKCVSEL